jgi:transcriptional regulator with XRE-family HTH domain
MRTNFGEGLRVRREKAGMSRADLATAVGAHETTIRSWERRERPPNRAVVARLAQILDSPFEDLLAGSRRDYSSVRRTLTHMSVREREVLCDLVRTLDVLPAEEQALAWRFFHAYVRMRQLELRALQVEEVK